MGKRILIGSGGVMLMAVLLLAAFSLGVYAGQGHLFSGQAPAIAGPGQPQPQPKQPAQAPDLVGRVHSLDPAGLTLATPAGLRAVLITPQTQFQRAGEKGQPPTPATRDDVRPGVSVAVFGRPSGDGRGLAADLVQILPAAP